LNYFSVTTQPLSGTLPHAYKFRHALSRIHPASVGYRLSVETTLMKFSLIDVLFYAAPCTCQYELMVDYSTD